MIGMANTIKDIHTTIMLVTANHKVLLAMKKRGFGTGKWNGPGGKLEPGESPLDAAVRECFEEVGITPQDATERAFIRFNLASLGHAHLCHIFVASKYDGVPVESEEMLPRWYDISAVPYNDMWQDDIYWLPAVLAGRKLEGEFEFDDNDTPTAMTIRQI